MKKFSSEEKRFIRAVYQLPPGQRPPFFKALKAVVFETQEEMDEYFKNHPNANPENHSLETPEQKAEEEKEDRLTKLKEKAQKKFNETIKPKVDQLKSNLNNLGSPGSMGDLVETMAALMSAILIPDKGGESYLQEIQDRLQSKSEEDTQKALEILKAAELAASQDEEIRERLDEEAGFRPVSDKTEEELKTLKQALNNDKLSDEDSATLMEFLSEMDDKRIEFLNMFKNEAGDLDLDRLLEHVTKPIEKS